MKHASGAPWARFFGKSICARNVGYDVSVRTDWGGGGEAEQPLGMGVFMQFSLEGNHVAALQLASRIFLTGTHISDKQWDKEQERALEKRH